MQQLKTLQSSDPAQFKKVTAEVATKLQEAAKSAAESGDSQDAARLNDLAAKFTTASETGEMPKLGHKGGAHHAHGGPPPGPPPGDNDGDSDDSTSTSSTSSSSTDTDLATNLLKLLSQYTQNSNDPMGTLQDILRSVLGSASKTSSTQAA